MIDSLHSGLCPGEHADKIKCCVTTAAAAPETEPNPFSLTPNPLESSYSIKVDLGAITGNKDLKKPAFVPNSVGTLDLASPFLEENPGSGTSFVVGPNSATGPNYGSVPLTESITDSNPQLSTWQDFFDDADQNR